MHRTTRYTYFAVLLALAGAPLTAQAQNGGNALDGSGGERRSGGATFTAIDTRFVEAAAKTSLAVLAAGQLATQKGSPPVQAAATRLVADHSQLNAQVRAMAIQKGYPLPADTMGLPDSSLVTASGPAFDSAYLSSEIFEHEQAVSAYREETSSGTETDFRNLAIAALPMLEQNLRLVRSAAGQ